MALLRVASGALSGREYEVDRDEFSMGRAPGNTLVIEDPSVSGHHCIVRREGQRYSVRDLGSTNGTYINGERVNVARLAAGDALMVGSVEMTFEGADVEAPPAAPAPVQPAVSVSPSGAVPRTAVLPGRSPFGARPDNRWITVTVVALICVLSLVALAWFLMRLFRP